MPKTKQFIPHTTNLSTIKDLAEFSRFLDRMSAQKKLVFHNEQWRNPDDLRQELGL